MSRTTENLYIRGVRVERVIAAIDNRLRAQNLERVPDAERARVERKSDVVRIGLRRDGRWITIADDRGFSGFAQHSDGDLDGWGRDLSRDLDRSVLAIWTWDGESLVIATRWKRGKRRARLELPRDIRRGEGGRPYAPAKVLWPWLPKKEREAILRDGIALVEPPTGTGYSGLDKLLEEFDDVDADEEADAAEDEAGQIYVPLETSVGALGAAAGMANSFFSPWDKQEGDRQLLFRPILVSSGTAFTAPGDRAGVRRADDA